MPSKDFYVHSEKFYKPSSLFRVPSRHLETRSTAWKNCPGRIDTGCKNIQIPAIVAGTTSLPADIRDKSFFRIHTLLYIGIKIECSQSLTDRTKPCFTEFK